MTPKKVLIFSQNSLHNGPRYIREIEALKKKYTLFAIGATPPQDSVVTFYHFNKFDFSFADKAVKKIYKIFTNRVYTR